MHPKPAHAFLMSMADKSCLTLSDSISHFENYLSQLWCLFTSEDFAEYAPSVQEAIDIAKRNYYYSIRQTDAYAVVTCESSQH